jgi:uracil-DNA glycosylase
MQRPASIIKMAGTMFEYRSVYDGEPIYLWPMIHPSFGLRQKSIQPLIERDWDKFGEWLNAWQSRAP